MPVPTSPVRPVLAKLWRVRTWLPALPLALFVAWVGATPTGARVGGPWVAEVLASGGSPDPGCAGGWSTWASLLSGLPVRILDACPEDIAPPGFRLRAAEAVAHDPRAAIMARRGLARLLIHHPDASPAALERALLSPLWRGAERSTLLPPGFTDPARKDLADWCERTAVGGLFDHALLMADADMLRAGDLLAVRADLDDAGRQALALSVGAFPERRSVGPNAPPPNVSDSPPSSVPPPDATGVLELVPERGRDHLAEEWAALLAFVKAGPVTGEVEGPEDRWRLAATSSPRSGSTPPRASVHAALRGEPAAAPVGAWVSLQLALEAGLVPEAFVSGARLDVRVGTTTLRTSRCGQRFPVLGGEVTPLPAEALHSLAAGAVASAALADGDLGSATDLTEAHPQSAPGVALVLALTELPPGWAPPPPPPLPPPRRRKGGRAAPLPPPPAPTAAELLAALEPRGAALSAGERALVAWWAAERGHAALADRWSAEVAEGAAEGVRQHVRARLASGAPLGPDPSPPPMRDGPEGCAEPQWPWPPER